MKGFLDLLKDPKLRELRGCLNKDVDPKTVTERFNLITTENPKYDNSFLWVLCSGDDYIPKVLEYIEANYQHFHQVLDSQFPKLMTKKRGFISRMWEMVIVDTISAEGKLIPKSQTGPDLQLEKDSRQRIQIEIVAPDESDDTALRSNRPHYDESGFYSGGGDVEDLERPIILRFLQGFDEKANENRGVQTPFIVAINTSKVVGLISRDEYVLRRALFGLGYDTITRKPDGSYHSGLQQNPLANKPDKPSFPVARFRDPKYSHVSGVIYSSQNPTSLLPGGSGWTNSGIVYVPNPMASNPADVDFDFFKRINCNEQIYEEISEKKAFESRVVV